MPYWRKVLNIELSWWADGLIYKFFNSSSQGHLWYSKRDPHICMWTSLRYALSFPLQGFAPFVYLKINFCLSHQCWQISVHEDGCCFKEKCLAFKVRHLKTVWFLASRSLFPYCHFAPILLTCQIGHWVANFSSVYS